MKPRIDDAQDGVRPAWSAIAWAEGLVLAGIALLGAAAASSAHFCTFTLGCDQEASAGGVALTLGVLGVIALLASPVMAARRSGWPSPGRPAALAFLAFLAALAAGAVVFGALVDDVLPALVLAIGVEGTIAVRPPWPGAMRARVIVVVALTVLATVLATVGQGADVAIFALAMLALPAVGAADATGRRNDQAVSNSTDVIEPPEGSS